MALVKNKYSILYVDDELKSLSYFKLAFEGIVQVYTAENAEEGLAIFLEHQDEIGVVLSDKRMPGMSGIEFLGKIRALDDEPLRILVTAFTDLDQAVEALNDGLLYSYLTKPWIPGDMKSRLLRALDRFWITKEKNKLLSSRVEAVKDIIKVEKELDFRTPSPDLNHYLKNSLSVVQAFVDMIPVQLKGELKGAPAEDPFFWNDYYKTVEDQLSRVIAILLGLSADEASGGKLNIEDGVDLSSLINEAAKPHLENSTEITFSIVQEADLGPIRGDYQKLFTLVSQIIEKSASNIDKEGTIEVVLSAAIQNNHAAVKVMCIDNGIPLANAGTSDVFSPSSIVGGQSLDLEADMFMSFITVFQHGGTIKVDKLSDNRNVIEFVLPVNPGDPIDQAIPFN